MLESRREIQNDDMKKKFFITKIQNNAGIIEAKANRQLILTAHFDSMGACSFERYIPIEVNQLMNEFLFGIIFILQMNIYDQMMELENNCSLTQFK